MRLSTENLSQGDAKLSSSGRMISFRYHYLAVGVLVGCALTLTLLYASQAFLREPLTETSRATLVASMEPVRPIQGRVAGQTAYAAYPTPRKRLLREYRKMMVVTSDQKPATGLLRDRAFLHLMSGGLDAAAAKLEEALQMAPNDAAILSDLSAVYGERARVQDRPVDYVAALEMAERAIEEAPGSKEALFNRAVALENLFLYDGALKAWQRYLDMDNQSDWANEARLHIKNIAVAVSHQSMPDRRRLLSQAIIEGNGSAIKRLALEGPLEARVIFEEELLPDWADATARDQRQLADLRLEGARRIANALADRGGDRAYRKIVAEMELVGRMPSKQRETSVLVKSLRRLKIGQDMVSVFVRQCRLGQGKMEMATWANALRELAVAEQELRSIGSAAVLPVRFCYGLCLLGKGEWPEGRVVLMDLGKDPLIAEYPSLEARRQQMLGFLAHKMGDPAMAMAGYQRALENFMLLGELPSVAETQHRMALSLESLGQLDESWRHRHRVLAWSRVAPPEPQLDTALYNLKDAASTSLVLRRPKSALNLQNHLVTLAAGSDDPRKLVWALLFRAQIKTTMGRQEDAEQDFQIALGKLSMISPEGRRSLAAHFDATRRKIKASEDKGASLAEFGLVDSLRADLNFTRGDVAAAEDNIESALKDLERQRANVTAGRYRISFFDQARPLYERMIALQLYLAQPEKALEVLERFRARTLLDQLGASERGTGNAGIAPLSWPEIRERMPERTAIVVYAVIEGRLVTWIVQQEGIQISLSQPSWATVSQLIQRLPEALNGSANSQDTFKELYKYLVAPWRRDLRYGDRIIFVPADSLYSIPFAALCDTQSERYLIQDHAIGIAPSVSQFLTALKRDRRIWKTPLARTLLIGDPAVDNSAFPWLPPLPASAKEVELLSKIYEGLDTRVLIQNEAKPARVLSLIGESDIVHMAVHAKADGKNPANSRLMLAANRSGSGVLTAQEILGLRLARTRLVMLASCETNAGPVSASEGSLSLTSAFLAAGVPAVVGSLWEVDDRATMRLSVRFHGELRRGADALSALRTAQLEEMERQNGSPHWTWASFQVFGGVAAREPR